MDGAHPTPVHYEAKAPDPSTSHLLAVNCHPFHDTGRVLQGLRSVTAAAAFFRLQTRGRIDVHVFWHRPDRPPEKIVQLLAAEGFAVSHLPHVSNGENLNRQIEFAFAAGHDLFFRIDSDDTVTGERFILQARALMSGGCDICGAGLIYVPHVGQSFAVLPDETPDACAYLENRFALHPTLAFRLAALRQAKLRYWSRRLEDKRLILDARRAGLKIRNLSVLAGEYHVGRKARRGLRLISLSLWLNLAFLFQARALQLVPYAIALFILQAMIGPQMMRRIRYLLHRAQTQTRLRKSPCPDHSNLNQY